jgi:hypothetical protein
MGLGHGNGDFIAEARGAQGDALRISKFSCSVAVPKISTTPQTEKQNSVQFSARPSAPRASAMKKRRPLPTPDSRKSAALFSDVQEQFCPLKRCPHVRFND